jgi:hypothetical protein
MIQQCESLPEAFSDLERFVAGWLQPTFEARRDRRHRSTMAEIREFYDAMTPRLRDALNLVASYEGREMPEDVARLNGLALSLAHAAIAVEVQRAPRVARAPYPDGLCVSRNGVPYA